MSQTSVSTTDGASSARPTIPGWQTWTVRAVSVAGLAAIGWVCVTSWDAIVHGHPLYPVLLALTVVGCVLVLARNLRPRALTTGWRRIRDVVLVVAAIGWLATVAWLRPFPAVEPALTAMESDGTVTVIDSATRIELVPTGDAETTAVFFQPGAKVEARASAAVLRPLAEAGYPVVIAKQPLSIAFLAMGAFDDTREAHPEVQQWVLGGHSLGGVVASSQADGADAGSESAGAAPVVGLLLYGSYPAGDISSTLTAAVESISGSQDGLSTPEKIEASRADLPPESGFTVIEGGVHAFFADYGPQPGDGTATISHDDARAQISEASVRFVDELTATP